MIILVIGGKIKIFPLYRKKIKNTKSKPNTKNIKLKPSDKKYKIKPNTKIIKYKI